MIAQDANKRRGTPLFILVGVLSVCVTMFLVRPAFAWKLHARTVANNGESSSCDRKTSHVGCLKRTRECLSVEHPVSAWAHASYHGGCKRHLDVFATPGGFAHAHHGPHSESACMRDSIESHYASEGLQIGLGDQVVDEDMPAHFQFNITIPPSPAERGSFAYTSVEVGKGEKSETSISFSPGSRLQVDAHALGPDRAGVIAVRACVASEDGKRYQDGLLELLVDGANQRLKKSGLFEKADISVTPHKTYEGVWVVELGP